MIESSFGIYEENVASRRVILRIVFNSDPFLLAVFNLLQISQDFSVAGILFEIGGNGGFTNDPAREII